MNARGVSTKTYQELTYKLKNAFVYSVYNRAKFHTSSIAGNHLSTAMAGTDFGFTQRTAVVDITMDGSFIGR